MKIELETKYSIGKVVFFIKHYTRYEEIPCTHCNGNYREYVNNIEYKCPYCNAGREKKQIDRFNVESGVITNIHIALEGISEYTDRITGDKINTNIHYCVTENRTNGNFMDFDGDTTKKLKGNYTKQERLPKKQ